MTFLRLLTIWLVFASQGALADDKRFGAWAVGATTDKDALYAATVNDSNAVLGQYCFVSDRNCVWLLGNDVNCDTDGSYVILMNSDYSAHTLEIMCFKADGKSKFAFKDFEQIDTAIKKSSYIGFAFPMQNGNFKVSRFNLSGALKAVQFMRGVAEKFPQDGNRKSTRDQTL
ncbi:MAG: hypothetical protein REI94_20705 [Moraxellaceae bacterium]|nr:hypothetical protein [Moraxellaceae bacterium]